jgi:putative phosphoribosyl transferase
MPVKTPCARPRSLYRVSGETDVMRFEDRTEAGQKLAALLAPKYAHRDGIVYALPRGGVVLGAEIAPRLGMPLDLVIARKIGHPHNPEYAIGAVTETGEPVVNPQELAQIPNQWFARQVEAQRREARRRHQVYLQGRAPLSPKGTIAILVDDGIATGLTMEAAVRELRRREAGTVVVAVPVAPADTAAKLAGEVDDFLALDVPQYYLGGVGAYYDEFAQVSDEQVIALLRRTAEAAGGT